MSQDITADTNLGRAVRVRWIDSGMHHDAGWAELDTFFDGDLRVLAVESVGIWIGENENVVALAQTRDAENGNWMAAQVIWKPAIKAIEWL